MTVATAVTVSAGGEEIGAAVERLAPRAQRRVLLGVAGQPGAGKSRLADVLAALTGAVVVPMDGWHLADRQLRRLGALDRKGAPDTFDGWGYAALLRRVREESQHPVYAPAFERDLEQPLAGAVVVPAGAPLVLTEGNYLLLDGPPWRAARGQLDAVWWVEVHADLRRERLVARHVASGKPVTAARDWVARVDDANAALVAATRDRADLVLDLTRWSGAVPGTGGEDRPDD